MKALRNFAVRGLLVVVAMLAFSYAGAAQIAVGIAVSFAPPELPVYEQPVCPGDDYLWTPGYWAWDDDGDDYYWVPGTWVLAPQAGYFWTPPYWGWGDGGYRFYAGYWGPQVGFYGGINYGFGYFGRGYEGGRWERGHFFYNRYVNNVNVTVVHNVYETRVENRNENVARVSFNGGNGGVNARATAQEESFARERHIGATTEQTHHIQAAQQNRQFRASDNHGKPPVAATSRPGQFSGGNVVAARSGGNYTPPANRGNRGGTRASNNRPPEAGSNRQPETGNNRAADLANSRPPNAVHPKELPPMQRGTAPNSGNARQDQKYQQQQEKMYTKQNQERQKLQQKQDQEHQRLTQQKADQSRQQQVEQKHQQQTQQMVQRHTQQQQKMQQRQAPPPQQHEKPPAEPKH